ncbi:UDP-N-acetylglucosamine--N-acetylmuramyl-(pentapeptide) pyrophosphoryl-undecaprenol N-acetylglucosamine transferase, partial [Olsenella phocaeensis]
VPGLANKNAAGKVRSVCVSLPAAIDAFRSHVAPDTQIVVTGNPVRRSVIEASREEGRRRLGIPEGATMLLVFGGSLGARHVNEAVTRLKGELLSREGLYVVHSTGRGQYDEVVEALALGEAESGRWQVLPYIDSMGEALAAADLVLSRAGASSIAEIAALCVPSVLVPYPLATGDHQTANARYLVDAGAARLVADDELDGPEFDSTLLSLVDDPARREAMRASAHGLGQAMAASALADQVEGAAAQRAGAPIG